MANYKWAQITMNSEYQRRRDQRSERILPMDGKRTEDQSWFALYLHKSTCLAMVLCRYLNMSICQPPFAVVQSFLTIHSKTITILSSTHIPPSNSHFIPTSAFSAVKVRSASTRPSRTKLARHWS